MEQYKNLALTALLILMLASQITFLQNVAGIVVWVVLLLGCIALPTILGVVSNADIRDASTIKLVKNLNKLVNTSRSYEIVSWVALALMTLLLYTSGWIVTAYFYVLFSILATFLFMPIMRQKIDDLLEKYERARNGENVDA
jgi:hypothetical protein